jgi:uncharacterized protein
MAFAQTAARRPIPGAVATLGVSDRVAFLRKTYGLLGVALIAFALLTAGFMGLATEASYRFSAWAFGGNLSWLIVLGLFMLVGYVAQRLAMSPSSRGLQLLGLGIFVAAESALLQPLLWVLIFRFGNHAVVSANEVVFRPAAALLSGQAGTILVQSVVITLAIFIGLTATVFLTKKDFSFLGGILTIASFAVIGVILVSMIFGFSLGAFFCGAVVLIMAGYILYQTSLVMNYFPPSGYVAAALMLFSTIATLFWYVLQLVMSLNDRR